MTGDEFIEGLNKLRLTQPYIAVSGYKNTNCDFSNATYNSRNCYVCFDVDSGEHCLYSGMINRCKTCVDCEDVWDSELCYEGVELYHCYNCDYSEFLRDSEFCENCFNSDHLFGRVTVNRKQYMILNKPYEKETWHKTVNQIKSDLKETGRYSWSVYF